MQKYGGRDRRKKPRTDATIVVSYHLQGEDKNYDLSQTKNISQEGILLTTNRKFDSGTRLDMTIQFPFLDDKIQVVGEVVDSKEVMKDVIYETRLRFFYLNRQLLEGIGNFVKTYLKPKSIK
jgi:hypothetical protein